MLLFLWGKIFFKIKDKNVRDKNTGLLYKIAKSLSVGTSIGLHDHQAVAVLHLNFIFAWVFTSGWKGKTTKSGDNLEIRNGFF